MAYTSEFTQFMTTWLDQHPEQIAERQAGRALWWDKPQDPAIQQAQRESKVAQQPYPYFQIS